MKPLFNDFFHYNTPSYNFQHIKQALSKNSSFSGVKITTIIPKGTKGMYIAPVSEFPAEKELLLQRGTEFKVKDFTTNALGAIIALTVEVVSQP